MRWNIRTNKIKIGLIQFYNWVRSFFTGAVGGKIGKTFIVRKNKDR